MAVDVLGELLKSPAAPVALGIAQKFLVDAVKTALKKANFAEIAEHYGGAIQGLIVVLTAVSTFGDAVLKGTASAYDPTNLIQFFVTAYLANQGAHATGDVVKQAVTKKNEPKQ